MKITDTTPVNIVDKDRYYDDRDSQDIRLTPDILLPGMNYYARLVTRVYSGDKFAADYRVLLLEKTTPPNKRRPAAWLLANCTELELLPLPKESDATEKRIIGPNGSIFTPGLPSIRLDDGYLIKAPDLLE